MKSTFLYACTAVGAIILALTACGDASTVHHNNGYTHYGQGDYLKAIEQHNRAIEDFDRALARAQDAALRARIQQTIKDVQR